MTSFESWFAERESMARTDFEERLATVRAHLAKDMARPDVARFLALYEKLDAADRWAIFHRVSGHLTGLDRIEELEALVTFLGYYMFDDGNIAIIDEPLSHLEIELIRNAVERDGKDVDTLVREALSGDRRRVLVAATDDTPPARLKDIIEALEYNLAREPVPELVGHQPGGLVA